MSLLPTLSPLLVRRALIGMLLLWAALLATLWMPSHQVRLHQRHLLKAVEDRNWKQVGAMISADYRDQWQQTKPAVLARLPEAFADFLACGIEQTEPVLAWKGGDCLVSSHLHFVGSGGPIAQFVIQQTDLLKEPFVLQWRHGSWKPWDWQLVSASQPEMEIPADPEL